MNIFHILFIMCAMSVFKIIQKILSITDVSIETKKKEKNIYRYSSKHSLNTIDDCQIARSIELSSLFCSRNFQAEISP